MTKSSFSEDHKFIDVTYMWLNSKRNIKVQTYQKYYRTISSSIKRYLCDILITEITKRDIILFFSELNNFSISFKRTVLYIIKASMNYAYNNGMRDYLDLKDVRLRKPKNSIYVFSRDEQIRLEGELKRSMNIRKLCLLLCLYTGLRIGEVCGLKWEDINFSGCYLKVNRTIVRIKNQSDDTCKTKLVVSTPKSEASRRIIPIPAFIFTYLEEYKNKNHYYILSNSTELYDPRVYGFFYKRLLIKCGIANNKFHTVRHTFATRCIESKMDIKTLSEILGHASVEITLELYVHPSYELKKSSIENLVEFMSKDNTILS